MAIVLGFDGCGAQNDHPRALSVDKPGVPGAEKMTVVTFRKSVLSALRRRSSKRDGNELEASRVHATSSFGRASGVMRARRAGRGALERVFGARMLRRISNFWALAARSVIGRSRKTVEIVEFWPGLSRRRRNQPPTRLRYHRDNHGV
jgi:hypothetical protein